MKVAERRGPRLPFPVAEAALVAISAGSGLR
jgi:hypothetical protein